MNAAINSTSEDFSGQANALAKRVTGNEHNRVEEAAQKFSALGYAFVNEDGLLLEIDKVRGANNRVAITMRSYAYSGWSSFLPLPHPECAPQFRLGPLLEREQTYLEGMRLETKEFLHGTLDYWRI